MFISDSKAAVCYMLFKAVYLLRVIKALRGNDDLFLLQLAGSTGKLYTRYCPASLYSTSSLLQNYSQSCIFSKSSVDSIAVFKTNVKPICRDPNLD